MFQDDEVVIHVVRRSRGAGVVAAVVPMEAVGRAMMADGGQADILEFLRHPIFG